MMRKKCFKFKAAREKGTLNALEKQIANSSGQGITVGCDVRVWPDTGSLPMMSICISEIFVKRSLLADTPSVPMLTALESGGKNTFKLGIKGLVSRRGSRC